MSHEIFKSFEPLRQTDHSGGGGDDDLGSWASHQQWMQNFNERNEQFDEILTEVLVTVVEHLTTPPPEEPPPASPQNPA